MKVVAVLRATVIVGGGGGMRINKNIETRDRRALLDRLLRMRALQLIAAMAAFAPVASRSFTVKNDAFMYDDGSGAGPQPLVIRSGSIHYHRTHPSTWADRLARLRSLGLNTVQTYVTWNFHSQVRGVYNFSGGADLVGFIKAVQAAGLLLNLRAGPYVCGETDNGGLPSYLLATPGINSAADLRTNNSAYLAAVTEWWSTLLPIVGPLTIANGGPIAMVQIENEFGSYGNTASNPADRAYMMALRDLAVSLLPAGTQLYTTDGNSAGYLSAGTLPGIVFATGDGSGPPWAADGYNPPGMRAHINSELYPGWLTHWGESMANVSAMSTVGSISGALAVNGSFNLYMGFGGTNFGYFNGANGGGKDFQPVITSYDYDAPIQEGGGHGYGGDGDKYDAIRRIIGYWEPSSPPPAEPPAPAVAAYGALSLASSAALWPNVAALAGAGGVSGAAAPPTFESMGAASGYVLYSAPLPGGLTPPYSLSIDGAADYAVVFLGGVEQGVVWRPAPKPVALDAAAVAAGAQLTILVENCGHLNYGRAFYDPKGITGAVTVNGVAVGGGNWSATPLGLGGASVSRLPFAPGSPAAPGPAFFKGSLVVAGTPADTYIALCGWGKGQVYVNGVHLGRQWASSGPQHAYFIAAGLLTSGANDIIVFETHTPPANVSVSFVAAPDFTGAVCGLTASTQAAPLPHAAAQRHLPKLPPRRPASAAPRSDAAAACAPVPASGTDLTLQTCDAGAGATQWQWTLVAGEAGILQLAAAPSLCAVQSGKNPDTGMPNIALGPCAPADRSQHWLPFPDNGHAMLNPVTGRCLDAEGGSAGAGARIETYGCDAGTNQAWHFVGTGPVQVVVGSGLCLAACAPAS